MIMLSHLVHVKKNLIGKIQCNPDVRGTYRPNSNSRPYSLSYADETSIYFNADSTLQL